MWLGGCQTIRNQKKKADKYSYISKKKDEKILQ
jgi:hypothetical protein